jgi:hypothetical protein
MNIEAMKKAVAILEDAAPQLPEHTGAYIDGDGRIGIHPPVNAQSVLRCFGGSWVKSLYNNTIFYDRRDGSIRVTESAPVTIPEEVVFSEQ